MKNYNWTQYMDFVQTRFIFIFLFVPLHENYKLPFLCNKILTIEEAQT